MVIKRDYKTFSANSQSEVGNKLETWGKQGWKYCSTTPVYSMKGSGFRPRIGTEFFVVMSRTTNIEKNNE
jgi:hypothetical protein